MCCSVVFYYIYYDYCYIFCRSLFNFRSVVIFRVKIPKKRELWRKKSHLNENHRHNNEKEQRKRRHKTHSDSKWWTDSNNVWGKRAHSNLNVWKLRHAYVMYFNSKNNCCYFLCWCNLPFISVCLVYCVYFRQPFVYNFVRIFPTVDCSMAFVLLRLLLCERCLILGATACLSAISGLLSFIAYRLQRERFSLKSVRTVPFGVFLVAVFMNIYHLKSILIRCEEAHRTLHTHLKCADTALEIS